MAEGKVPQWALYLVFLRAGPPQRALNHVLSTAGAFTRGGVSVFL